MNNRNYKLLGTKGNKNNIMKILRTNRNLMDDGIPVGRMKNMDITLDILHQAKEANLKILIIGDYDVDGVVSTYELVKGLRDFGLETDFRIPDRLSEGYGISLPIVKEAYTNGYKLVITCDNGISSNCYEVISQLDIQFIITDHHNPLEDANGNQIIPKVQAILNPKQRDCTYKYKNICGAVVVLELLKELMGNEYINNSDFIELAALATVCDVVDLNGLNREIVIAGLDKMLYTKNKGLKALIDIVLPDIKEITMHSCGFVLGPCINAAGRLESASISLKTLLCEDDEKVKDYANYLSKMNADRRLLTESGLEIALNLYDKDRLMQLIVLPTEYESVQGIIAGRLKEKYNKPTLVCCYNSAKRYYKGSGRSTNYYDMFREISKSSRYLISFGGHPMAIGFSILDSDIDAFKNDIENKQSGKDYDTNKEVYIDLEVPLADLDIGLVSELKELGPFGSGNPKPQFIDACILQSIKRVGKDKNILNMTFQSGDTRLYGVNFNNADEIDAYIIDKCGMENKDKLYTGKFKVPINVVYTPSINEYKDRLSVQLLVESII